MYRRLILFLVLILATAALNIAGVRPAHAGAQRWSAWMFDSDHGILYLLTDTMGGNAQAITLPLQAGYNVFDRSVAISHDWHYIAYGLQNSASGARALAIYNREANNQTAFYAFPPGSMSLGFDATENLFNEANTGIAIGHSINEQSWEIKVFNYGIAAGVPTLASNNPAVLALGIPSQFMLPVVRRYSGMQVTFTMIHTATEGAPHYDSYLWDITSGQVRPVNGFSTLGGDFYPPTGETVSEVIDPRFPTCGETCSPFSVANAVSAYNPVSNTSFPFFATQEIALYRALFIQNGERVLAGGFGAGQTNKWAVLERSGAVVGNLPSGVQIESTIGWQDGFLFMPSVVNPSGSPQLFVVNTRNAVDGGTLVWTGTQGTQVRLQQTPSNQQGKGPFTLWGQLAPPASATVVPPSTGVLTVGGQAIVNTTQGDKLRMRSGPGTSFAVITSLSNGTLVTLLEGPHDADGLRWWRVRAPGGQEGWVIESINDNGTRLQTLVPA